MNLRVIFACLCAITGVRAVVFETAAAVSITCLLLGRDGGPLRTPCGAVEEVAKKVASPPIVKKIFQSVADIVGDAAATAMYGYVLSFGLYYVCERAVCVHGMCWCMR